MHSSPKLDWANGGLMSHEQQPDALQDFDFLFGTWRIHNRRLSDDGAWQEFDAYSEAYPILGKLGNVQTFNAPEFPGRAGYEGYALRLFDPDSRLWRIW